MLNLSNRLAFELQALLRAIPSEPITTELSNVLDTLALEVDTAIDTATRTRIPHMILIEVSP
jgi:hypothetical protein